MKKFITVFTDGSCLGNPGPGGFCTIIKYQNIIKKISTGFILTTNNRMELMSVIIGLKKIKIASYIKINTDSQYVKNGITKWIKNWKKNNWLTKNKKKVKNIDLWKKLYKLVKYHIQIKWFWIKSHSGQKDNEKCDIEAKKSAKNPKKIDFGYIYNK
jgi:ribonuclease HI